MIIVAYHPVNLKGTKIFISQHTINQTSVINVDLNTKQNFQIIMPLTNKEKQNRFIAKLKASGKYDQYKKSSSKKVPCQKLREENFKTKGEKIPGNELQSTDKKQNNWQLHLLLKPTVELSRVQWHSIKQLPGLIGL